MLDRVGEEFLRGLVAHLDPSAVLVAVRSADGDVVDLRYRAVNEAGAAFLGLSPASLQASTFLELFPHHRGGALFAAFASVFDTGEPLRWDDLEIDSAVRPGGTRFDLRGTLVAGELLVLSWRDNTERAAAAARLAASEAQLRALAEHTSDAVLCASPDGTITWVSGSIERSFGWRPDQIVGRKVAELIHPDDLDIDGASPAAIVAGKVDTVRRRIRTGCGDYRWVSSHIHLVKDDAGNVVSLMAGWRDVHDEQLARIELHELNERLDEMINLSSDAVVEGNNAGEVTWASSSVRQLTGWEPAQLVGQRFLGLVHPDDQELVRSVQSRVLGGVATTFEARIRTSVGDHRWISFHVRPLWDQSATEVIGRITGWRDAHAEHIAEEQLARSDQRFHAAMQSAPIGMAVVDLERRMTLVNPSLSRLVGQLESWLLTRSVTEILDPLDVPLDQRMRARLADPSQASVSAEMRLLHRNGTIVWVRHVLAALRDDRGRPWGYVSQFLDITDVVTARETLRYQATHDPLTHVGNREQLHQRVERMLGQPTVEGRSNGVLFIDVDHLKSVNDAYGHATGDHVLVDVARYISACTRADDVVVRYGGDEFVVVITGATSTNELVVIAEKIRDSVARYTSATPDHVAATVSIGVALSQPLDDPQTTMRNADEALYRAKQAGRNRIEAFEPYGTR